MQEVKIKNFKDLEVYQNSYRACILVITKVLPLLPNREKFDLAQAWDKFKLRARSTKTLNDTGSDNQN